MGFSRALRLIRSSNARLTCLAVELRHKASFPPKVWQLPSATAEQSDTTLHPVTEDNHPRGEPHARRFQSAVQLGTTSSLENAQTGFCVSSRHEVVRFIPFFSKTFYPQEASDIQEATS
jgi:hypothetical protein